MLSSPFCRKWWRRRVDFVAPAADTSVGIVIVMVTGRVNVRLSLVPQPESCSGAVSGMLKPIFVAVG